MDLKRWLASVPSEEHSTLWLRGVLLEHSRGEISLLVQRVRLRLAAEDVARLIFAQGASGVGGQVAVECRIGAMLLGADQSDRESERPFALKVRPRHVRIANANRFREMEHRFLEAHGLTASK